VDKKRKSNRLQGYDYSLPGAYFVTLVTQERRLLFGVQDGDNIILNKVGQIAKEELLITVKMRKELRLDQFIVMPNHLHAILFKDQLGASQDGLQSEVVEAHGRAPLHRKPRSLGAIVAANKAASTRRIRELKNDPELQVWQRNYYDHIVRDQNDLEKIREYILYNPLKLSSGVFPKGNR